ncbi:YheT family hydrolase [uncultured Hydrogenophaga sp.]|uniref:YheT family hydrolase n=1 Tax=uncultured Hydrogenophaga sp. TaxID=199683 RepID=UPI00265E1CDA|nr:alpha/beta fold hydrolase [uncultured Hydrogenophaga sp.]
MDWPFQAPWWLPGGNLQTLWAALLARTHAGEVPRFRRERWNTPDGDFVDVDHAEHPASERAPVLVVFHGLEGSSGSAYVQAFASWARDRQIPMAMPHFRGCSGELNLAPRAYHSGDHEEIDWMLSKVRQSYPGRQLVAVGISLGGNALMRWAAEQGSAAGQRASAVASVCSPLDLAASGHAIGKGFNRQVYTRMFLSSMVPKALAKLEQHPGLFDRDALLQARDLHAFDNVFTGPLHGFAGTDDYWARASAKPLLPDIRIPALALNALNDPFIPAESLPTPEQAGRYVSLWQPEQGGHVGFVRPARPWGLPGHVLSMPAAVGGWLLKHTAAGEA